MIFCGQIKKLKSNGGLDKQIEIKTKKSRRTSGKEKNRAAAGHSPCLSDFWTFCPEAAERKKRTF